METRFWGLFRAGAAVLCAALVLGGCGASAIGRNDVEPAVLVEPTAIIPAATEVPPPTATVPPVPTATPVPTPVPTVAADMINAVVAGRAGLGEFFGSPLTCELVGTVVTVETLWQCAEPDADLGVRSAAAGRVVMAVTTEAGVIESPPTRHQPWTWDRGRSLGSFVVVDHGSMVEWGSVMTVYAGLGDIDPSVKLGTAIAAGDLIGSAMRGAPLQYEIWTNGWPHGVEALAAPDREATPMDLAPLLARISVPPTGAVCPFPGGDPSSLPNTARPYRNGVHRGVDLVCGVQGLDAYAFADGEVAMVVRDYVDAAPADREALLVTPTVFGRTPHWTLAMLFGNFVVVDHGEVPDVGRTYSIYAHLEEVDEAVQFAAPVVAGQRLGEIGDRGTSQGAEGTTAADPSRVHLHWELFVEHEFFGVGLGSADTEVTYRMLLCDDPELLNGC